ncbi:hypothetical protein ACUXZJ_11435 [Flavobacterium sp. TN-1]
MNISKKWTVIVLVAIVLFAFGKYNEYQKGKSKREETQEESEINVNDKAIKGLMPVDIYMNLEKKGYQITKNHSAEYGNIINCKNSDSGIDYIVDVYGDNENPVLEVRATASLNGMDSEKKIIAVKPFIKYISSIPYEGSNPSKISDWLEKNFDNNGASIIVSDVKFTLNAPTKFVRMLNIQKS